MKRIIALILCVVLVFVLCGCGSSSSDNQNPDSIPEPEPGPAPLPANNGVKVGFIYLHDEASTYDLNFLEAAHEACEAAGVPHIDKTNISEGNDCYEAAADLVDAGCNIVFADSFGHEDYLIQAAREFPEVQFCHATGTQAHTERLPNFHNAFAAIYEGRYLAGIAAGMKLNEMIANGEFSEDEAVIGYIGAYPYAEVKSGYTSFFLGARSVCPSATMKVVFTNSWYDEALEKEGATRLIQAGCKLISQHADSMGAPSACENAGVPNVSYNGSTISACPNTFIVSSRINWVPYFAYIISCVQNGATIVTDWTGTINTGSVELTDVNENVAAAGTVEAIEKAKEQLETKEIAVFDTNSWTVDGNHLDNYMADVNSDPSYTADTNVIFDGFFHESEFRSAPYFDINIDGIEILD